MKNKVSVVVPCFNSEKTLDRCIGALLNQKFSGDFEIVMVDDGSTDSTVEIIKKNKKIKYIFQKNSGPAKARNNGWKHANGDIVVFTDSDCVPEKDWLKLMISPFGISNNIGAVGGAYGKTINSESLLASLIGEEIKFRYKNIGKYTDAHGSYSLAIRKNVLEKISGYNEFYPVATAEDWDLCYRIQAAGYKIYFNRKAKVGHHHPAKLVKYLKTQFRHGFYRVRLYKDNPKRVVGDKYSGNAKYVVVFSGLFLLFLVLNIFSGKFVLPFLISFLVLVILNLKLLFFLRKKKSLLFAFDDFILQFVRGFAWFFGMIKGVWFIYLHEGK